MVCQEKCSVFLANFYKLKGEGIMEKRLFIKKNVRYENRDCEDKELIIFPDIPFWFVGTNGCKSFLDSSENMTQEEFEVLKEDEKKLLEFLIRSGSASFIEKIQTMDISDKMDIYPLLSIWVNVDSACNLNCKHCFLGEKDITKKENMLSPEDYRKIASDVLSLKGQRPIKIDITGGEPLLRSDFLEIVEAFNMKGIDLNVITNGILLTDKIISSLSKIKNLELTISLDGVTKEQHEFIRGCNTFNKTVENIRKCTNAGISTTLTMTVHKGNQESIIDYFSFAEELGAVHVNLSFLNDFGNAPIFGLEAPDEAILTNKVLLEAVNNDVVYNKLMDTSVGRLIDTILLPVRTECCGAGINTCSIGADGNVYPCPSFQIEGFVAGNVKETSIQEIWRSINSFREHRDVDISTLNPICSTCDVRLFCGGGCRAQAYFTNNKNLYARSKKCLEYKRTILDTIWLLDKYPKLAALHTTIGATFRGH